MYNILEYFLDMVEVGLVLLLPPEDRGCPVILSETR